MLEPDAIIPCANQLGEGVLCDSEARALCWTDILSRDCDARLSAADGET